MQLLETLRKISSEVEKNPLMSEDDLYGLLIRRGFFDALGYAKFEVDVKPQYVIPGERKKADYVCRDEYQNSIFVLEAKKPSDEKLELAFNQLWERYVLPLRAAYGLLTNGKRLIVYKRSGNSPEVIQDIDLGGINEGQCSELYRILKRPDYEITLYSKIEEYFGRIEKLSLETDLAKDNFFETFKLSEESIFGKLVIGLVQLFDFIYPHSKFLKGAYGFWQRSFARAPERTPESWRSFVKKDDDLSKFMFCLESAHALLARLILAKACEDLKFPGIGISDFVIRKINVFGGQIPRVAYPITLLRLLKEMKDQLVYSIFEEDIFGWWSDGFLPLFEKSSKELIQEKNDRVLEEFGTTIAKLLLIIYKYDFSKIAGDPLGDLYQKYFDGETRKALGEFYTPVEIVNYILDAVDYNNVRHRRLLDPACGSGTFLVEALKRYLREIQPVAKKEGWAFVLRELCNSPRIVGFDIHPFACLIAQIRFMLELVPYYRKAFEEERAVVWESLQRLPIFRTDSLAVEMNPQEFQREPKLVVTEEDIRFSVALPIEANREENIAISVIIPSWKKTSVGTQYNLFNLDEYFCVAQAIFDAIKAIIRSTNDNEIQAVALEPYMKKYLNNKDFHLIAVFFKPYADQILAEIRRLQTEFEDGRLIKSIEDSVLAALLKNYFRYNFVVGNPPYVRIQLLSKDSVKRYSLTYQSAFGKFDLYFLFLERGVKWLEKGSLGYICSNKFMQVSSGTKLRKFVAERCQIRQIVDFGDSGVFEDVTNYPCIIILDSVMTNNNPKIKCVRVAEPKAGLLKEIASRVKAGSYGNDFYDSFEYPQNELGKEIWKLMPEAEKKLFEKIEKTAKTSLKKVAERIFTGIQSGSDKIYLVSEKSEQYSAFEKALFKPFLKGEDIRRWKITWRHLHIIFPHKEGNGKLVTIGQEEMSKNFPTVFEWIKKHEEKLRKRVWYGRSAEQLYGQWYALMYAGDMNWYGQPKILTPALANTNNFALDAEGFYFPCGTAGGFGIAIRKEHRERLLYFLGLLNSKLLEYYVKHISPRFSGGYYKYNADYLAQLPIKLPETPETNKIADLVAQDTQKILNLACPEKLLKEFPDSFVKRYSQQGVESDLIKHTFQNDHDKLEPFLSGQEGERYFVYPSKREDPIWVDSKEKAEYLALAFTKKSVKRNEIVEVLIPKDNSIVKAILNEVRTELGEFKAASIQQLENEIDDLTYRLYGITESERVILEDFLEKF